MLFSWYCVQWRCVKTRSHNFLCRSLLLSTTVLHDAYILLSSVTINVAKSITLIPAIPNITQQPTSVTLRENSEHVSTLWCLAIGVEPLSYLWQMYQSSNDSWTRPSVRAINITSSKLVFSKLTEEDEGIYRCIVFSDDDNVISDNATITLYGELQF